MRDSNIKFAAILLDWYDTNARELPWRVPPSQSVAGVFPDPYRVWLSEIMLQQTTVATVKSYFAKFTERWPTVEALAGADDGDVMAAWAGLGYYARARNLLKCARVVAAQFGGVFPSDKETLLSLPGIGPYTAAAIGAIAFGRPEVVVDGNVERVMARIFAAETPLPTVKPALVAHAGALTPTERTGDYAQAVMDLGATICSPKSPNCVACPVSGQCLALRKGIAAELPARVPKKAKPIRLGYVYIARRDDGAFLLERRPPKGLLGGMLGWPGSDWNEAPEATPPFQAAWRTLPEEVRHTFTHFHLRLAVCVATAPADHRHGMFVEQDEFRPSDLPTVMRKAYDVAAGGEFEN